MAQRGGGCLKVMAALLSVALVAAVAVGVALVLQTQGAPSSLEETKPEPQAFSDYSWEELSALSSELSSAASADEATSLAASRGVHVGDMRRMQLTDGTVVDVTVVGICADTRADGSGTAGLTLMCSPLSTQPMNEAATNEGGWEASGLRAWLAGEGFSLLPPDLAERVVSVTKRTNNVGVTGDVASVTETADTLWAFSASEVCGPLTWFSDEYGDTPTAQTAYVDYTAYDKLLSAEGSQYAYFAQAGVTGDSDPSGALAQSLKGASVAWWYRTAYPYSFTGQDKSFFYQVMATGFPSSVGDAPTPAGVVVGFCL